MNRAAHCTCDGRCGSVGCTSDRIIGKVRVLLGRLDVPMTQNCCNHREGQTTGYAEAVAGMAKVMDTDTGQTSGQLQPMPHLRRSDVMAIRLAFGREDVVGSSVPGERLKTGPALPPQEGRLARLSSSRPA